MTSSFRHWTSSEEGHAGTAGGKWAEQCGLRSIIILLGALDALPVEQKVLSYEGPFGVGYLVASFKVAPAT